MTPADLIAWRTRLGLTRIAAAEALGVHRNSYGPYEVGRSPIPLTVALACAAVENGLPPLGDTALRVDRPPAPSDSERVRRLASEMAAAMNDAAAAELVSKLDDVCKRLLGYKWRLEPSEARDILRCLHPDNSASDEVRTRAFRLWNDLQPLVVMSDAEVKRERFFEKRSAEMRVHMAKEFTRMRAEREARDAREAELEKARRVRAAARRASASSSSKSK